MKQELASRLAALPPLASAGVSSASLPCKICGGMAEFFDVTDFWKGNAFFRFGPSGISIQHYRCRDCGFMWAPLFDDWTAEDFKHHIYNDEYGFVDGEYAGARPKRMADHMAKWLAGLETARILDYGSGNGLFAQHLRDAGFKNVANFDPFSEPARPSGRFDVITCFEVIEHSPTPVQTMNDLASLLAEDGCIILGESLQPPEIARIRCSWWYCMPRNGHISFYTDRALVTLAASLDLLFHQGGSLHAFSRPAAGKFANLARRIAPPLLAVSLGAPQAVDDSQETRARWHGVERPSSGPTRWTRAAEISWRVVVTQCTPLIARLRVPFVGQVRPGFASDSRLLVDGVEAKTSVSDGAITAEFEIAANANTVIHVTLRSPPVMASPRMANNPGRRQLGLAIPCQDASSACSPALLSMCGFGRA